MAQNVMSMLRRTWGVHAIGMYRTGCHLLRCGIPSSLLAVRCVHRVAATPEFGGAVALGDGDAVVHHPVAEASVDDTVSLYDLDRHALMLLLLALRAVYRHGRPVADHVPQLTRLLAASRSSSDTPFLAHLAARTSTFFPNDTATALPLTLVAAQLDDALRIFISLSHVVDTDMFRLLRTTYHTLNSMPQFYNVLAASVRTGRLHLSASVGMQDALRRDIERGMWNRVFAFLDMWRFKSQELAATDQARIEVPMTR
jgi:hypothetical protein